MTENLFKVVHKASEIKQEDATGLLMAMPVKEHILRIEVRLLINASCPSRKCTPSWNVAKR